MSGDPTGAVAHRVTIALPTHGGTRWLRAAVASVRAQTYDRWRLVVVDDASTDGTADLADELARGDDRIEVVRLERNVGVAVARDTAIRHGGPAGLVALLDQDDVLEPEFLGRCVALYDEALAAGRRPGVVACDAWLLDDAGTRTGTFSERFGWTDEVDLDALLVRNCICARAVVARAAYDAAGGFAREAQPSDDYDLWLRIAELGFDVVTTRERLAGYRLHDEATSRDLGRMAQATIAVHRRALARGRLSPAQARLLRARVRHGRALVARAELLQAVAQRRWGRAAAGAPRAAGLGAVAFVQAPGRWREWLGGR